MTNFIIPLVDLAAKGGGYTTSIVSILVVFIALLALVVIFTALPKILHFKVKSDLKKSGVAEKEIPTLMESNTHVAICMALHMYFDEMHDEESNVITIHNAPKQYSPWSSKIYSVYNQPSRK